MRFSLCPIARLVFGAPLLIVSLLLAQGSSISIDSNVDKSTIKIGDLVNYTILVTRTPDVQVEMPGLAANLGAFEIRDYEIGEPQSVEGKVIDRFQYTISTFDVGEFEIPPLEFRYTLPNDSTKNVLKTKKITILVESLVRGEAGNIRDVKSPLELPRDLGRYIFWGSIGLAGLLILATAFYVWRRKKAGKGLLPKREEPPRPAHEIAFEELSALKVSGLLDDGQIKQYYVELAEIIRRYIEGRYFIIALELTTLELIQKLESARVELEFVSLIQEFLVICDLVKFAKYRPTDEENASVTDKAFEIVERTKLVYEPAEEKEVPPEPGVEETPEPEVAETKELTAEKVGET